LQVIDTKKWGVAHPTRVRTSIVNITLPDGETERFVARAQPECNGFQPILDEKTRAWSCNAKFYLIARPGPDAPAISLSVLC